MKTKGVSSAISTAVRTSVEGQRTGNLPGASFCPVKFTQWALRDNSGGPGRNRGGLGAVYEIELLEEEATCFLFGDRGRFPPRGVCGGGDAEMTRFTYPGPDGPEHPPMASKIVGVKLKRGQRVTLETPGGGGYGPPEQRSEAARERDVALGYAEPRE